MFIFRVTGFLLVKFDQMFIIFGALSWRVLRTFCASFLGFNILFFPFSFNTFKEAYDAF